MKSRFLVFVSRLMAFLANSSFKVKQPVVSSLIAMLTITPKGISRVHYSILPNFDKSGFPEDLNVLRLSIQFYLIDMSMVTMQVTVPEDTYRDFVNDLKLLLGQTEIVDPTGTEWNFIEYWSDGTEKPEGDIGDEFKNKHYHEGGVESQGMSMVFKKLEVTENTDNWPSSLKALLMSQMEQEIQAAQEDQEEELEAQPLLQILEENPFAVYVEEGSETRPPLLHSIGMCRQGLPEIIVIGLGKDEGLQIVADVCTVLLTNKITEIPAEGIIFGSDEHEQRRCILKPWISDRYAPADVAERADWYAMRENKPWSLGQVFWSDENGKFEWEEGFNQELAGKQVMEI